MLTIVSCLKAIVHILKVDTLFNSAESNLTEARNAMR